MVTATKPKTTRKRPAQQAEARKRGPAPMAQGQKKGARGNLLLNSRNVEILHGLVERMEAELREQVAAGACTFSGQYVTETREPQRVRLSAPMAIQWVLRSAMAKAAEEMGLELDERSMDRPPQGFQSRFLPKLD